MKKIFCVLAAVFVLLFAFTGCTGGNGDDTITADSEKASILVSYVSPEDWETSNGIGMVVVTLKEAACISEILLMTGNEKGQDTIVSEAVFSEWGTMSEIGNFYPASTRFVLGFQITEPPQGTKKYTVVIHGTQNANDASLSYTELKAMTLCRIDFTL